MSERGTVLHMQISFKRKTGQSNPSIARRILVLFFTATFIVTLLLSDQIIPTLSRLLSTLPSLLRQATAATNMANQMNNNNSVTIGMPSATLLAQQIVWTQSNTVLLDIPSTGRQIAHVGPH